MNQLEDNDENDDRLTLQGEIDKPKVALVKLKKRDAWF